MAIQGSGDASLPQCPGCRTRRRCLGAATPKRTCAAWSTFGPAASRRRSRPRDAAAPTIVAINSRGYVRGAARTQRHDADARHDFRASPWEAIVPMNSRAPPAAPSIRRPPSRQIEHRPGAERALAARQPARQRRDFLDDAETVHRDFRAHVGDCAAVHCSRIGVSIVAGVIALTYAVLGEFLAERLGQADHRRLRRAIGRGGRIALLAGDRGHVDDPAVAARLHRLGD